MPMSALELAIVVIMFSVGSAMHLSNFRHVFVKPRALLIGLALQIIFLPVLAYILIALTDFSPYVKIGILILFICPGGTMANFISYLTGADVPLAMSLSIINDLLIIVTVPVLMEIVFSLYCQGIVLNAPFSVGKMIGRMLLLMLLPAAIGMAFNHFFHSLMAKAQVYLKVFTSVLLLIIYGMKFLGNPNEQGSGLSFDEIVTFIPLLLLIHVSALLVSYFTGRRSCKDPDESATIAIQVGIQNTTVALFMVEKVLPAFVSETSKPILVYAIFSFCTTALFGVIAKKYLRTKWS